PRCTMAQAPDVFTARLAELVRANVGAEEVVPQGPLQLRIRARGAEPVDVPLDHVWRAWNGEIDQGDRALHEWVDALAETVARVGDARAPRTHEVTALLAHDRWRAEAHALDTEFEEDEPTLLHRHFVADLHVVYAVDLPRSVRALSAADRRALAIEGTA